MAQRLKERVQEPALTSDLEEIPYRPMPPKKTFPVQVELRLLGRAHPLPYSLEDVDPE